MSKKFLLILFPCLVCAILTAIFSGWKVGLGLFGILFAINWALNSHSGQ